MPAMAAAFASLKRSELADATPQLNVLQRVGGSIGTARARGRAPARAGRGAHARRRRAGLRDGVLVAGGAHGARDRAVHHPACAPSGPRARPRTTAALRRPRSSPRRWRHEPPSRTEALDQLGRSFKGAMAAVRRLRGRETHRPGELSFAQYSLLFGLGEAGELSVRELALAADLAPATVTQMLDSLEAAGLVERVRSQRDRRVVLISLTERGAELVADAPRALRAALARRARRVRRGRAAHRGLRPRPPARDVLRRGRRRAAAARRGRAGRRLGVADQSVSARPKAAKRSEPKVVISAIAPSSTRRTSSLKAR